MQGVRVTGHGGVGLHVSTLGDPAKPPLILIHGWSQHGLSWSKQHVLADAFHLIVPDLRGHGASDKPDAAEAYDNAAPWAGDVAALVALCERPPLLVGWSMGGRVIGDYLSVHGDGAIAGIVTVGTSATGGKHAPPAAAALRKGPAEALGTYSTDQAEEIAAVIAFVKVCAAAPLSKQDLAMMVGLNMLCPPHVRRACRVRDYDHRPAYAALTRPCMIVHGTAERLCVQPLFDEIRAAMPDPVVHLYNGAGHMPFWESPERFNDDLAAFARSVFGDTA